MQTTVSIIVPCYNEQSTIQSLLEAVYAQTYPRQLMQVLISDGFSSDGTRRVIAAFQAKHSDANVTVLDNPKRTIPAALNIGVRAGRGDVLIRLDAHCIPNSDYVERAVTCLEADFGDNVGGVWEIQPGGPTWIAKAIAAAAGHLLGAGDAAYRLRPVAGLVDTVPFGCFRRTLVDRIGPFDESLLANEDYEFNTRIRRAGGRIWLDPTIRSVYFARPTLRELARQYWRYGFWKWRMARRYPGSIRVRQAAPPLFVASLSVLTVISLWSIAARFALLSAVFVYVLALGSAGLLLAYKRREPSMLAGVPAALAVMHLAWAAGFLWSMLTGGHFSPRHG